MISSPASTLLESGASAFDIVDTYEIGTYTFDTNDWVIRPGAMSGAAGLEPRTLDVTIVCGGAGGPGEDFKADALSGALRGVPFTYTQTFLGTGGGPALLFTGTVQRAEASSTEVRIVAMTCTVDLDAVQLPNHVIAPAEFPEIPPPEQYNVR